MAEYLNEVKKSKVFFGANGKLTGVDGFDSYQVRNYFGTLHPHKNLDVVTFKNSETNEYKDFNWVFSGNSLRLTAFIIEKVIHNGKTYDGDQLILSTETMNLKLSNHNANDI